MLFHRHEEFAKRFKEFDKDGNDLLSEDEVVGAIMETLGTDKESAVYMIKMFDQNQDGSLDKAEFVALWSSMFG